MDYCKIGEKIRKFRKAKGLSQEQLAEIVDVSVTHISHIETGNTKLSLSVFLDIANALEVQANDLLNDEISGRNVAMNELSEIFDSCTEKQIRIIVEIIKSMKVSFDKFGTP